MSRTYFFPDNTVLINFTLLDRQDLVEWFTAKGTRLWTTSVYYECDKSAEIKGQEAMVRWRRVFGKPLSPEKLDFIAISMIVDQMRLPGETAPRKHMGEAETIAIAENRYPGSVFLTDDHDAARVADARHIQSVSTTKIIAFAEVKAEITHDQARGYLAELLNRGRVLGGSPRPTEYDAYVRTLKTRNPA